MPEPTGHPEPLTLWRAYVPRWAYLPLSGEGAARFGGRWNPVGAPTIYAALELSTAWAEYNQGFVQHPALIARLELSGASLADLTDSTVLEALGIDASIHACEWRDVLDRGEVPPTYLLRDILLAKGVLGVIYPSFMSPGGRCAAIWRWNNADGPTLSIVDPEGRMPKTPASWV
ncbi:RES family NAD+ phosphorylase [Arvimicrobium flavum]|uniref:RES family NAD+ phosphorylase n=1 Tax=Arvimicrobium flavum TaxID=3393320 RepID=UPI00237B2987|nr:RES domain-containing protein [Mesorhizobium shangrilense]